MKQCLTEKRLYLYLFFSIIFATPLFAEGLAEVQAPSSSDWDVVFATDFSSEDDWNIDSKTTKIANNKLIVRGVGGGKISYKKTNLDGISDFKIATEIEETSNIDGWFGLIWGRGEWSGSRYYFEINNNGGIIIALKGVDDKTVGRKVLFETKKSKFIKTGFFGGAGSNKMVVEKRGETIHCYINDNEVASFADEGLFGLQTGFFVGKKQKLKVSYLQVSQDNQTRKQLTSLSAFAQKYPLDEMVFSHRGKRLATLSYRGKIAVVNIWDNNSTEVTLINSFAVEPVAGGKDKDTELFTLKQNFSMSINGEVYAYVNGKERLTVVSQAAGEKPVSRSIEKSSPFKIIALDSSGQRLAISDTSTTTMFDSQTGETIAADTYPAHSGGNISSMRFMPNGKLLFNYQDNGKIFCHNTDNASKDGDGMTTPVMQFSPDGKITVAIKDGNIEFMNTEPDNPLRICWDDRIFTTSLKFSYDKVLAIRFTPENQIAFLSIDDDNDFNLRTHFLKDKKLYEVDTTFGLQNKAGSAIIALGYDENSKEWLLGHKEGTYRLRTASKTYIEALFLYLEGIELIENDFEDMGAEKILAAIDIYPQIKENGLDIGLLMADASMTTMGRVLLKQHIDLLAKSPREARLGVKLMDTDAGLAIKSIRPGIPTADLFAEGDIITAINQQPLSTKKECEKFLEEMASGDTIVLSLLRQGEPVDFEVSLGYSLKGGATATMALDLIEYAMFAVQAGHPGIAIQAANRLRYISSENPYMLHQTMAERYVVALEALAMAAQGKADEAYRYIIKSGGIVDSEGVGPGRAYIQYASYAQAWMPLFKNRKKLAYLIKVKESDLPQVENGTSSPVPYPDLTGKLIEPPRAVSFAGQTSSPTEPAPASNNETSGVQVLE